MYVCGLTLGSAAILNQNPNFETASSANDRKNQLKNCSIWVAISLKKS